MADRRRDRSRSAQWCGRGPVPENQVLPSRWPVGAQGARRSGHGRGEAAGGRRVGQGPREHVGLRERPGAHVRHGARARCRRRAPRPTASFCATATSSRSSATRRRTIRSTASPRASSPRSPPIAVAQGLITDVERSGRQLHPRRRLRFAAQRQDHLEEPPAAGERVGRRRCGARTPTSSASKSSATARRKPREIHDPGTFYEYNDVRINRFALSLLRIFGKGLPDVLEDEHHGPDRRVAELALDAVRTTRPSRSTGSQSGR